MTTSPETRLPGYFTKPPILSAVRQLREYGGFQDACVALSELSLAHLMEDASAAPEGIRAYVDKLAQSYGMRLGLDGFNGYRHALAGAYVVQIHQVTERFLLDLNDQLAAVKRIREDAWVSKGAGDKKLSPLQQFAANLSPSARRRLEKKPEFDLLEYYRLSRNWIVHPNSQTEASAQRFLTKMRDKHEAHFRKCYLGLVAPNEPAQLLFDDFYLFTRAIKYFATELNNAAEVTPDEIAVYWLEDEKFAKTLRGHEAGSPARRRVLRARYIREFGLPAEGDINWLLSEVDEKMPPKR